MKKILLIAAGALLILAACGPAPDFVTANGVRFYVQGRVFTLRQANDLEGWFTSVMERFGISAALLHSYLDGVTVYLWPYPMPHCDPTAVVDDRGDGDEHCANGYYKGGEIHLAIWTCGYDSAYPHELLHRVLERHFGDMDRVHGRADLWSAVRNAMNPFLLKCA